LIDTLNFRRRRKTTRRRNITNVINSLQVYRSKPPVLHNL